MNTTIHSAPGATLARFRHQHTVSITTYRRDGSPVATPVFVAVDGDRAYVRTWSTAGKARRLRRDPRAAIAPSTFRGKVTGPPLAVDARQVSGDEARHAARLLRRKHPIMHGVVVPLAHRLRGLETVHYELRPSTRH